MLRSTTIAVQREEKRRIVTCIKAISYSWVKINLKLWELTVAQLVFSFLEQMSHCLVKASSLIPRQLE